MDETTGEAESRSMVDPQQFDTALDDLKQAGCLILITGTVDATVRAACSRRLFGALSHPHQRVIVHPDTTALCLSSYLPLGLTSASSAVYSVTGTQLRGETATISDSAPVDEQTAPCPGRDQFDALLAEIEPTAVTFDPGELRVGILTVGELLDQYGQSAARTVLTTVRRQIRARHGIAHCHLPAPSESAVASALAECTDIHLRLREREGNPPEQQWDLRDADCGSGWLPLDNNT